MNSSHSPARRLPWLLALSGCLHLLVLLPPFLPRAVELAPSTAAPLALRLAPRAAPASGRAAASTAPAPAPASASAPARQIAAMRPAPAGTATPTPANAGQQAGAPETPGTGATDIVAPAGLEAAPQYALRRPDAKTLLYEVQADGLAAAGATATLALSYTQDGYSLRLQGAPDAAGSWDGEQELTSEGALTDGAFAPLRAGAGRAGLPPARISLNKSYSAQAASSEDAPASARVLQDRASLLMQLIGMGLQDPSQFETPVQIAVADQAGVTTATFALVGKEEIKVAAGTFDTWHLAQQSAAGSTTLELWLAPELGWYPVLIKTTAPDGAVVIQRLLRADTQ